MTSEPKPKEALLNNFFDVGGNHKPGESKIVENELNAYIEVYGDDVQINDLIRLSQMEEIERLYNGFEKSCEILAPTLNRLANIADLDQWDVRILSASIGHTKYFEDIQSRFEKKFLKGLEKHYSDKPIYDTVKMAFSYNASVRLLRARFIEMDNEPTKELKDMFDAHIAILLDIYKGKEEFLAFETTTLIRKGTFYNDDALVDDGFKTLEVHRENETYKMLKSEYRDYQTYADSKIGNKKLKKVIGKNIREKRMANGMTQAGLAEMMKIDATHLSNVENGRRGLTSNCLLNVASIFKVPLEVLMGAELADVDSKSYEDPKMQQMNFYFDKLTEDEKDLSLQFVIGLSKLN
ncbi:MAG: helix-turn-helix domain-containing protein [Defluviitaleaceae bacterium]|nr:helix-turn-helix domain-containing protein [Defluviitaleaceae bacterium]